VRVYIHRLYIRGRTEEPRERMYDVETKTRSRRWKIRRGYGNNNGNTVRFRAAETFRRRAGKRSLTITEISVLAGPRHPDERLSGTAVSSASNMYETIRREQLAWRTDRYVDGSRNTDVFIRPSRDRSLPIHVRG